MEVTSVSGYIIAANIGYSVKCKYTFINRKHSIIGCENRNKIRETKGQHYLTAATAASHIQHFHCNLRNFVSLLIRGFHRQRRERLDSTGAARLIKCAASIGPSAFYNCTFDAIEKSCPVGRQRPKWNFSGSGLQYKTDRHTVFPVVFEQNQPGRKRGLQYLLLLECTPEIVVPAGDRHKAFKCDVRVISHSHRNRSVLASGDSTAHQGGETHNQAQDRLVHWAFLQKNFKYLHQQTVTFPSKSGWPRLNEQLWLLI